MRRQMAMALVLLGTLTTAGTAASATGANLETEWKVAAGVTPDSFWYGLDRTAERLHLAFTSKVEKRAALQFGLAVERASEAVVMTDRGKAELAAQAAAESSRSMADAAANLQTYIGDDDAADPAGLQSALELAHKQSLAALARVVAKAPPAAQETLKRAMANQEKTVLALAEFRRARSEFQAMNGELQNARKALAEARRKGDPAAVLEAEARIRTLEGRKTELEELKSRAEKAREAVGERIDEVTETLKKAEVELKLKAERPGKASGGADDKPAGKESGKQKAGEKPETEETRPPSGGKRPRN